MVRRGVLCAVLVAVAASGTRVGAGQAGSAPPLLGGVRVIEGRVLNPQGQPVPNVFVTVLAPDPRGERPFIPENVKLFSITNSQGEFRLDVSVGQHYLVALPQNLAPGPVTRFNRQGYGRTFYPNAADISGAQMVTVTPVKPTRVDITILPARLALVSGTVLLASGQPATGGVLRVSPGDGFFGLAGRAFRSIRPDGQFLVPALSPGTYHLHYAEGPWPPPLGAPVLISTATVTVAGSDLTGVRVAPIVPIRVTGRVIVEPTGSAVPEAAQLSVSGFRVDGNPGPTRPPGIVNDDLTFEFRAWPGANRINVRLPDAWVVRSIRLNGVDASKQPVDFQAGKDVTGLDVAIARR